jgi:6-phosphogluconolactonase
MPELYVYSDPDALAHAAALRFSEAAGVALRERGVFHLALAGGSTPRDLYAQLASPEFSRRIDWSRTHCFWGDERCVPPTHALSNFRLASRELLERISIPPENIHRIRGELPPTQASADYDREMRAFFGPAAAPSSGFTFDLAILGLGEDGHTASLFPGSPVLEIRDRWAAAVGHDHPPEPLVDRVSLTLPALNTARAVIFLVSGESKAAALEQVLGPSQDGLPVPARQIRPLDGDLIWLVDRAAAGLLSTDLQGRLE